jgi:hypothetical protein
MGQLARLHQSLFVVVHPRTKTTKRHRVSSAVAQHRPAGNTKVRGFASGYPTRGRIRPASSQFTHRQEHTEKTSMTLIIDFFAELLGLPRGGSRA